MKKWIALILTLCICVSLFPVMQAQAYDPYEVGVIWLEGLSYPITGREADFDIQTAADEGYHIDANINGDGWVNGIRWRHYASVDCMKPGDTYTYGLYLVSICFELEEGYHLADIYEIFATHLYGVEGDCQFGTVAPVEGKLVVTYGFEARDDVYTIEVGYEGLEDYGTVSGGGTYYYGDTCTLIAKPNMGFALGWWEFEGDENSYYGEPYSFTVTKDENIMAIFVRAPFEDICGTDYYYKPICWAVGDGITTGTSETTFSPNDYCTRAQAVTFLWRFAGSPPVGLEEPTPFTDVPADAYYGAAVDWAVAKGITTGTSETTFSPDAPCTRAQIVTFLWRMANEYDYGNTSIPFTDVPEDSYYYDAVRYAVADGITTGTTETTFSPDAICTRGQIVTFLWRGLTKG